MLLTARSPIHTYIYRGMDLCLAGLAFVLAYYAKLHWLPEQYSGLITKPDYRVVLLLHLISTYMGFAFLRIFEPHRNRTIGALLFRIVRGVVLGQMILVLSLYIFKQQQISRLLIGMSATFTLFFVGASRVLLHFNRLRHFQKPFFQCNIVLVGSRSRAEDFVQKVEEHHPMGYKILACLDTDPSRVGKEVSPGITIGSLMDDFFNVLLNNPVDEVVFAVPIRNIPNSVRYIGFAETLGINVRVIPEWQMSDLTFRPPKVHLDVELFLDMPTISMSSVPRNTTALLTKSLIDYCIAVVGIVVLFPFLLLTALIIRLTSRGSPIFVQERCGLNGRRFKMYKFRTMVEGAEQLKHALKEANEASGPVFKIQQDPRVTRVGRFLRKYSLDEIPQLLNVLRGQMSLVGPRPPLPSEVELYKPWQRRRLSMKPGLTCIWQVSSRATRDFDEWMRMDLEYIDNWSLGLDLDILLRTFTVVFRGTGR